MNILLSIPRIRGETAYAWRGGDFVEYVATSIGSGGAPSGFCTIYKFLAIARRQAIYQRKALSGWRLAGIFSTQLRIIK